MKLLKLRGVVGALLVWGLTLGPVGVVQAQESGCGGDLEALIARLIKDLPAYANRELRRTKLAEDKSSTYIVIAGRPEFEPLPLGAGRTEKPVAEDEPKQVFITTLERVYWGRERVELQGYHWLFFTPTEEGWQLVMMFSRIGTYPSKGPIYPPVDTSNGVVAGAVRTWLRDCQSGSLRR